MSIATILGCIVRAPYKCVMTCDNRLLHDLLRGGLKIFLELKMMLTVCVFTICIKKTEDLIPIACMHTQSFTAVEIEERMSQCSHINYDTLTIM